MPVIDSSRIQAMLSQLRAAEAAAKGSVQPARPERPEQKTDTVDFAQALKNSLDQVNASQVTADQMGQRFVAGDDSVNLSDVMISMQKANISFQATIQVRNKLVSAYHDIMNMQI